MFAAADHPHKIIKAIFMTRVTMFLHALAGNISHVPGVPLVAQICAELITHGPAYARVHVPLPPSSPLPISVRSAPSPHPWLISGR